MSAKIFLVCLAAVSLGLVSALPTGLDPASEGLESSTPLVKTDGRLSPEERVMKTLLKLKLAKVEQFKEVPLLKGGHLEAGALGASALLGSKFGEGEGNVGQYQGQPQHVPSSVTHEEPTTLVLNEFHSQQIPALQPATLHESAPQVSGDYDSSPPATSNGCPGSRTKRGTPAVKGCAAGAGAFAATNGLVTAVAPNPFTAIVAGIFGMIAAVCGILDSNS